MIFEEKYLSHYILLTDQISLSVVGVGWGGGGCGGFKLQNFEKKTPQVYLIIIRE